MARQIYVNAGLDEFEEAVLPQNSQNPYWILVTFPYNTTDTFDRGRMSSPAQAGFRIVSRSDDETKSRKTEAVLFDLEIKNWQVAQTKSNHIHSLSIQMFNVDGDLSLLEILSSGDWCMFWSFRDRATYEKIRRRLIKSHKCTPWTWEPDEKSKTNDREKQVTGWQDGLKFVGRLNSPRHTEYRNSDGSFEVGYSLQAYGFTELESTIYYDDVIRFKYPSAVQFYQDLGLSLEKFLQTENGFVNTNVAVPALTQILLGKGPGVLSKDRGDTQVRPSNQRASIEDSPNVQFEVPEIVGNILNTGSQYYSDVLMQIIGDQTYGGTPNETDPKVLLPEIDAFANLGAGNGLSIYWTKNPIIDYFPPDPLDFKNQTVWNILKNYTNEPINEVYTCFKPHPVHGGLMPTLIVRRSPYSSKTYQANSNALKAIAFSDLPRWVIPDSLMMGYDIGRTDSARFNYVHVTPSVFPSSDQRANEQLVRLQAPPVVNKVDVMRHGLRTYITRVSGFANPTAESQDANTSRKYTEFIADILMDAHLRYNGTLTCVGIQEPIQPGDNIVFNGILFHIEGVTHQGGISPDGSKTFQSSFSLSHGVPLRIEAADATNAEAVEKDNRDRSAFDNLLNDPIANTKKKHKKAQKKIDAQKRTESEKDRIEAELRRYKEPPEDSIRSIRNKREELKMTGLVGAKTHHERVK